MTRKVAVAVIHGIGRQLENFAEKMVNAIDERCRETCGDDIVIRSVWWAPVLQDKEDELWERMNSNARLDYDKTRRFLMDFGADAIAYQIAFGDRSTYDGVHSVFAATLKTLGEDAGPDAPLCIISHSLGTIVASNFIYDLQATAAGKDLISSMVRANMGDTPLDRGETLALLYTLGSPLALWSLRYNNFGVPISIPSPNLSEHHSNVPTEWVNMYDRDDVIGWPLKTLNELYDAQVTEDKQVNVGNIVDSLTPASHVKYWQDKDVADPISQKLIATWQALNP